MLHKRLLSEYSTKSVKLYAIPQTEIIGIVGVKFTGGGHWLVYSEIPDREIWIAEELMASLEGKYYILHEWHEVKKMLKGMSYDDAHVLANRVEGKARKDHHENLDDIIQREIQKNNDMIAERSHFNGTLKLHVDGVSHHSHHKKSKRKESFRNNGLAIVR